MVFTPQDPNNIPIVVIDCLTILNCIFMIQTYQQPQKNDALAFHNFLYLTLARFAYYVMMYHRQVGNLVNNFLRMTKLVIVESQGKVLFNHIVLYTVLTQALFLIREHYYQNDTLRTPGPRKNLVGLVGLLFLVVLWRMVATIQKPPLNQHAQGALKFAGEVDLVDIYQTGKLVKNLDLEMLKKGQMPPELVEKIKDYAPEMVYSGLEMVNEELQHSEKIRKVIDLFHRPEAQSLITSSYNVLSARPESQEQLWQLLGVELNRPANKRMIFRTVERAYGRPIPFENSEKTQEMLHRVLNQEDTRAQLQEFMQEQWNQPQTRELVDQQMAPFIESPKIRQKIMNLVDERLQHDSSGKFVVAVAENFFQQPEVEAHVKTVLNQVLMTVESE